ncbi:hypothetical protein K431DRAFT_291596 [Polychaeton citri CBS 116435]|uniref:Uncharacterized protein n=1 Tax=Polychaeton citri CBS 116435 TaxID=1314669 RepID=A0A9P4QC50_9PEZI|nr:hypothetical protein K431DRAFT_291596 [Polychaeton citri CBS 116435]
MTSRPTQMVLELFKAVDYVSSQGIDVGVVQQAHVATSVDRPTGNRPHSALYKKYKHSIKRNDLASRNIKTCTRSKMLAIILALNLARKTIKQDWSGINQPHRALVFSDLHAMIQAIPSCYAKCR